MSIAEKLTQIAENEQKVYDAGFAAGQAQGVGTVEEYAGATSISYVISFYFDETEYHALSSMTWEEFCESEYDADYEFYVVARCVFMNDVQVFDANGSTVLPSDEIIEGHRYSHTSHSGGSE